VRRPETPIPTLAVVLGLLAAGCAAAADPVATAAPRTLDAGFVIVDGVYNTELAAPFDVFEHTRHHSPDGRGIHPFTVSPDGGDVVTAEGLRIAADYSFADAPEIDILVVPSTEGSRDRDRRNRALIDFVRERGTKASYVMSLCWGAFVLAEAGLLDGHACTTFPDDYERFAQDFPDLDLRFNVSFVHDGGRLTSQGGVRSYDAAMYLVDLLLGPETAAAVGRGLLIPWPPTAQDRPAFVSRRRAVSRPGRTAE
jgi:transcriptional regulator GlxA family with amidase domain